MRPRNPGWAGASRGSRHEPRRAARPRPAGQGHTRRSASPLIEAETGSGSAAIPDRDAIHAIADGHRPDGVVSTERLARVELQLRPQVGVEAALHGQDRVRIAMEGDQGNGSGRVAGGPEIHDPGDRGDRREAIRECAGERGREPRAVRVTRDVDPRCVEAEVLAEPVDERADERDVRVRRRDVERRRVELEQPVRLRVPAERRRDHEALFVAECVEPGEGHVSRAAPVAVQLHDEWERRVPVVGGGDVQVPGAVQSGHRHGVMRRAAPDRRGPATRRGRGAARFWCRSRCRSARSARGCNEHVQDHAKEELHASEAYWKISTVGTAGSTPPTMSTRPSGSRADAG